MMDKNKINISKIETYLHGIIDGKVSDNTYAGTLPDTIQSSWNDMVLIDVGNAINDLSERFYDAGYEKTQPAKTDWTDEAEPSKEDLLTYIDLVGKIRDKVTVLESTPRVPSDMHFFGYKDANDIEKILTDVDLLLNNSQNAAFYSGELYGGEL
jgi:hypothetical protein